jgi:hypothetical protein
MRILARLVLATAMTLAAASAQAQTYDPGYPICLQSYGPGGYISCSYTSMGQCGASASGRSAQCITNPYFAALNSGPTSRHRRMQY